MKTSNDKSFSTKTIAGIKWNLLTNGVNESIAFIVGIILARLLSPQEFGIIGMVVVLTGFFSLFTDFGFTSAIIQDQKSTERHWSSVFWLNLLFSLLIVLLFVFLAPMVARFYDEPVLQKITVVIAFSFILQTFTLVPEALLRKEMRFKELAIVRLAAQVIAGFLAILAAWNGFSYWSLVIKLYVSFLVSSVGVFVFGKWKPKYLFDRAAVREMIKFSLPLVGSGSINYWTRNIDYLLIGKVLGDAALGIYTRAYTLMLLPVRSLSGSLSSVLFPAYSTIQGNKKKIKKVYLEIIRSVAFLTFPSMFGLCAIAEPFVYLFLGEKWEGAIPVIQILAPLGALQSIGTLSGNIFLSQGKTQQFFKIGLISRLFMIFCMIIGLVSNGLLGIATAYLLSSFFMLFFEKYHMGQLIGLNLAELMQNLVKTFFASAIMAGCVAALDHWLLIEQSYLLRLSTQILLGVAIYMGMVFVLRIKEYHSIFDRMNLQ